MKVTGGVELPNGNIGWWTVGHELVISHGIITRGSIDLRGEAVLNFQGLRLLSVTIADPRCGSSVFDVISTGIYELGTWREREGEGGWSGGGRLLFMVWAKAKVRGAGYWFKKCPVLAKDFKCALQSKPPGLDPHH